MTPLQVRRGRLDTAVRYLDAGRYESALHACDEALRGSPRDADALRLRGAALLRLGRFEEGRRTTEQALRARPSDASALYQLALACAREGRFDQAHEAADRALGADPGNPRLAGAKAEVLCTQGRYEEALALARSAWRDDEPEPTLADAFARAARQCGRLSEAAAPLERSLEQSDRWPAVRPDLLFALAETLDALGDFDSAFDACAEAHALVAPAHEPEAQSRGIDALIHAWTPERAAAVPRGPRAQTPVFIVGFWRSGTTLVEQILSCHPAVAGAGELNFIPAWVRERRDWAASIAEPVLTDLDAITPAAVRAFSARYHALLSRAGPRAKRITDKMPVNFVHLGLISAAFPGARVIVCERDPVDTCLSCWFNVRGGVPYAHDLYACGRFHRDAERLIAHWQRAVDAPVLTVRYEDLVREPEAGARRLVEFAGLPWDDACAAPHRSARAAQTRSIDQVRRPVYTSSVGRALSNYGPRLGPLLRGLEDGAAWTAGEGPAAPGLDDALDLAAAVAARDA